MANATKKTQSITYKEAADRIVNYCKSVCVNCNGNSLSGCYVNGYTTYMDGSVSTTTGTVNLRITKVLHHSVTSSVANSTVESNMSNFLVNNLGLTTELQNKEIDSKNYFNFLVDLASFVSTKVCMLVANSYGINAVSTSTANDSRIVYMENNTTFSNLVALDMTLVNNPVEINFVATDVVAQVRELITALNNTSYRVVSCYFSTSMAQR